MFVFVSFLETIQVQVFESYISARHISMSWVCVQVGPLLISKRILVVASDSCRLKNASSKIFSQPQFAGCLESSEENNS